MLNGNQNRREDEDEEEHDLGRGDGVGYQLTWVFYVKSAMYVLRPKPKVK